MVAAWGTFRFRYMFRYTVVAPCLLEALFCWVKGARFDSCLRTSSGSIEGSPLLWSLQKTRPLAVFFVIALRQVPMIR